jgi:hypothetical protein
MAAAAIEDSKDFEINDQPNDFENKYRGQLTKILHYYVLKLRLVGKIDKPIIKNILLIDNSGSMGHATKEATLIIGSGMFDLQNVIMKPGSVIIFADNAQILSDNIRTKEDLNKLIFPQQGQTNITAGIEATINHILSNHVDPNVHYIVTFLSDGGHNAGLKLAPIQIKHMRELIDEMQIKLSIIVVGILNPDITLGMQIKTGLETCKLNNLESIYYAQNQRQMSTVIEQLNVGCVSSLYNGHSVNLEIEGGIFIENLSTKLITYVSDDEVILAIKSITDETPIIFIDSQRFPLNLCPIQLSDIQLVFDGIIPKLSQLRIAYGANKIKDQINELENMIDMAEKIFEEIDAQNKSKDFMVEDIGKVKINPLERLKMIKKIKQNKQKFLEERNKLKMLIANIQNDSAKQAEYLKGINNKYSGKAMARAGTVDVTVDQVSQKILSSKKKIEDALMDDQKMLEEKDTESSILSMNNAHEELFEWIRILNDKDMQFDSIYSLLVCFGFPAVPVEFVHTNAVQMDPFQTLCKYIEACPIDTASLMLSNQMKHDLRTPSNKIITDGLILVSPICPDACLAAMKTPIYEYLCSITLCRDLYMYHPRMTFSMHAHAYLKTVEQYCETKSLAYLNLAIRILYSIRKYWGSIATGADAGDAYCLEGKNVDLFRHWLDWKTITQSEADSCNHPVQLLLMLGVFEFHKLKLEYDNLQEPLINLLNEVLARNMKIKFAGMALQTKENENTKAIAVKRMQKIFGINAENSPKPNPDVLVAEPPLDEVKDSCQHWIEGINDDELKKLNIDNIEDYINDLLLPYLQAFHFGLSMQKYLDKEKPWSTIIAEMEQIGNVPSDLTEFMEYEMHIEARLPDESAPGGPSFNDESEGIPNDIYTYIMNGIVPQNKIDLMCRSMFLQAALCHDSVSRHDILVSNILDPNTFNNLIIDLRLAFYFEACKFKREEYLKIIGDVTFGDAIMADDDKFDSMCGSHTHGFGKQQFWSLCRAAKGSANKRRIFLSKSSDGASVCFERC